MRRMKSRLLLAALLACTTSFAQEHIYKAPTAADWAALAKLPDFSGVWERGTVGTGGTGNAAFGPQPTRGANPGAAPARGAAPAAGQGAAGAGQRAAGAGRGQRAGGGGRGGPSFKP